MSRRRISQPTEQEVAKERKQFEDWEWLMGSRKVKFSQKQVHKRAVRELALLLGVCLVNTVEELLAQIPSLSDEQGKLLARLDTSGQKEAFEQTILVYIGTSTEAQQAVVAEIIAILEANPVIYLLSSELEEKSSA